MSSHSNSSAKKNIDISNLLANKNTNQQRALAIEDLTKVLKANPKSFLAYKLRGMLYLELGLKNDAKKDLKQASNLNLEDDSVLNLLGMAELALGEKQVAIKNFTSAIELNHSNQQAFFNRGRANYSLGKHQEAIADFKRAILLDTKGSNSHDNACPKNSNIAYQLELIKKALADIHTKKDGRYLHPKPLKIK